MSTPGQVDWQWVIPIKVEMTPSVFTAQVPTVVNMSRNHKTIVKLPFANFTPLKHFLCVKL